MTSITQRWGLNERQFWLFDHQPEQRVAYDEKAGLWNVYGYPEALEILSDPATFSSNTSRLMPDSNEFTEGNLVQMDPPQHKKLRSLVSHAFTPKVVADLEPRIRELTNELLDAVADQPSWELVETLAYPLPVIVIAELLGVPASDRTLFKKWVDAMFSNRQDFSLKNPSAQQQAARDSAYEQVRQLSAYLGEHVAERRRIPRDDLITKLTLSEVDGQRLADTDVVNFALILLVAGHITTTMLVGNTTLCLDAYPEYRQVVRADRSKLPAVIEESLRFLSPFAALGRVTNKETELGGTTVGANELLMVWIAAANRDDRAFANPGVFDPNREHNPHLAFGRGIHFCVGAPLARLEGKLALDIMLDRFPDMATNPEDPPEFLAAPTLTGVRRLPVITGH